MFYRNLAIATVAALVFVTMATAPALAEGPRRFSNDVDFSGGGMHFDSAAFQSAMNNSRNLGSLAKENTPIGGNAVEFGFAAKSEEAKFFLIGTLYSESLAFLSSGDTEMAVDRIKAMEREFIDIGVTSSLYNYITKLRNMVERGRYDNQTVIEIFSLFQPFFEDFARSRSEDKLLLFQTGSWLVDMGLAAASGNNRLLAQTEKLKFLDQEMKRMDAPKGVIDALEEITGISQKEKISERDADNVLKLVKKMQSLLG